MYWSLIIFFKSLLSLSYFILIIIFDMGINFNSGERILVGYIRCTPNFAEIERIVGQCKVRLERGQMKLENFLFLISYAIHACAKSRDLVRGNSVRLFIFL